MSLYKFYSLLVAAAVCSKVGVLLLLVHSLLLVLLHLYFCMSDGGRTFCISSWFVI